MQQVLRPYVTAGVALVGASTIALTPLAPPLPHVQLPSIRLASASDFLGGVGQEFGNAVAGVWGNVSVGDVNPLDGMASLGAVMLQDPGAQGLSGILGDYSHLFTSFAQVATTIDGHWVLQEPVEILDTILGNGIIPSVSNIADLPGYLVNDVFPALVWSGFGSIDNTLMELGNIGDDLGGSLTNADPSGFFGTLAAAPAELVNALLFEHGGSNAFDGFLVPFTSLTDTGFDALLKQLPELIVNELFLGPGGAGNLGGLFADGSLLNIPYNLLADVVNIPFYESLALQEYAYALGPAGVAGGVPGWIPPGTSTIVGDLYGVGGTGSWWMQSLGNTWGWDNGNWPQLDAISHFLLPFQFTEPIAEQVETLARAEFIDGAHIGCEFECANPLGYLGGWFHGQTPLLSLLTGTTFPNTIQGEVGNPLTPVDWAGQPGAHLNLLEPLQAIAANLTASPTSDPIRFPDPVGVFTNGLKLGQDLMNDFNPFVPGSFLYWGLPTDYSIPTAIGGTIQDFTGIPNQFGFPADQALGSEPVWGQTAGPLDLLTRLPQAFEYLLTGDGGTAGNGLLGYLNPEIYLQALSTDFHLLTNPNDLLAALPLVGFLGLGNPDVFAPGSLLGTLGPAVMNASVSPLGALDPTALATDFSALLPNIGTDLASSLGTNLATDLGALLPGIGTDLASMLGTELGPNLAATLGPDLALNFAQLIPQLALSFLSF